MAASERPGAHLGGAAAALTANTLAAPAKAANAASAIREKAERMVIAKPTLNTNSDARGCRLVRRSSSHDLKQRLIIGGECYARAPFNDYANRALLMV